MNERKTYTVTVHRGETVEKLEADEGKTILSVLLEVGDYTIDAPCGGKGTCGKCKVVVESGRVSDPDERELGFLSDFEQRRGTRLACMTRIQGDTAVRLHADAGTAEIVSQGKTFTVDLDPLVKKTYLELDQPQVHDQRDDLRRVTEALGTGDMKATLGALRELPEAVRATEYRVTAVHDRERLLCVDSGDTTHTQFGIAVDIGTTTVVGYLMDLRTGKQVDVLSGLNNQKAYGGDVIARINYTIQEPGGLEELRERIVTQIDDLVADLAERNQLNPKSICSATVAGNTTMMHLFAGLPPKYIAASPFVPVATQGQVFTAENLGFAFNPRATVYTLPSISGYVGADVVAGVLASSMGDREELSLLVDIGTNGEIVLGNNERLFSCSTAAGPAFEGAHIAKGVGGISGAINTVRPDHGRISYTTIRDAVPVGICGSGIIDTTALLVNTGIVDPTGRFLDADEVDGHGEAWLKEHIVERGDQAAFIISGGGEQGDEVYFTQKDLREVQLAKAAVAAGINVLMKEAGVGPEDVAHVYLAGGFGSFIDKRSALAIGLFPAVFNDRIEVIGNAAGTGAVMCLLSQKNLDHCDAVKDKAEYVELSTSAAFQDEYIDCMTFGEV